MPQLAFLQTLFVIAIVSFLLVCAGFPVTAKAGWRAGRAVLRGSLGLLLLGLVGTVAWGASSGELSAFRTALGPDAALQMGMFYLIMYSTMFLFVSRYVASLAAEEGRKDTPDA